MSSPAYTGARPINGMAVAARCKVLTSPTYRRLIWFVQGISLSERGLNGLVKDILEIFPDRFGTPTMHRLGIKAGKIYTAQQHYAICGEMRGPQWGEGKKEWELLEEQQSWKEAEPKFGEEPAEGLRDQCRYMAEAEDTAMPHIRSTLALEDFLIELCVNPRLRIHADGIEAKTSQCETDPLQERRRPLRREDFQDAELVYFRDIVGALLHYKQHYEDNVRTGFRLTNIGRQIWKELDEALKTKRMILIDGLEGRGKTEAVRAWCDCHLGEARFVTLDGATTKTTQFRAIAEALGLGHGSNRKMLELEANVSQVLRSSHLMLVIDEAHHFFNTGLRVYTRPEMLDWIDTALCNPPLPVALIATPQFLICVEKAAVQAGWNYRQFKRRCKRTVILPENNTLADIEAITRSLLPDADKPSVKAILGYVLVSKRDLSAMGDAVNEAKLLAEQEGASKVSFEHVYRAIHDVLLRSDEPWAQMAKRIEDKVKRKGRGKAPIVPPDAVQEPGLVPRPKISAPLLPAIARGSQLRLRVPTRTMDSAHDLPVLTPG